MNALQRLSVEPDTKRPEMVVIVEDNLLLAPYAKQMQAIIDGYSNGIRLICCGIELIDPNAHRIWQDDN